MDEVLSFMYCVSFVTGILLKYVNRYHFNISLTYIYITKVTNTMAEDQITNVKLRFTCPQNWDNIAPTKSGRHCDKCNKTVYDFTNSKADEFQTIMAENSNGICGRFRVDQMAPVLIPKWKKWISAALVLIGFNVIGCQEKPKPIGKIVSANKQNVDTINDLVIGDVAIDVPDTLPEYPGGQKAFFKFINRHSHLIKDAAIGRIIISFDVNTNGTLTNYRVLKGLNSVIDSQALSVVKKMPKWHPAIKNGKAVKFNFVIPYLITGHN